MSKVEIFEKERASGYNQFVETWIPNYNYFLDRLPKLFSEAKHDDLLVVGCGTGNEIARFVDAGQSQIIGVDPSPEMISQARAKFDGIDNVFLVEGFVSDLEVTRKYGAATLLLVLHFLDDNGAKLKILNDISARLKPGAPFVILDITGDKEHIRRNLAILRQILPDGLDAEQISNRLSRIENDLRYVSEARVIELFEQAGFETPTRFFQSAVYMGWLATKRR